jgi:ADP-heptose:LPS heptosyltransferase
MLTLPMCVWLRTSFPNATIVFLCKKYTRPVVQCFQPVNEILLWEDLAPLTKKERKEKLSADVIIHVFPNKTIASWALFAGIPHRIGTSHRWYHTLFCNHRPSFTRLHSPLHESQLNFHLLKPLGLDEIPDFDAICSMKNQFLPLEEKIPTFANYVILHPLSQGSAMEYPIEKYEALASELTQKGKTVLITGTHQENQRIQGAFAGIPNVHNLMGELSLSQLICLIQGAYSLIACSTGPLHIAGALNVKTIGLFSPRKPIHPGRWKPLGTDAHALVFDQACQKCFKGEECNCIQKISTAEIVQVVLN